MLNKVILIGRLVADPELRTTPSGVNVCRFRIAVDRAFKQGGERKADFFGIVAWRQQADFVCSYFAKGRLIGVEGAVQNNDYTDMNGVKHYSVEIVSDKIFFVESKEKSENSEKPAEPADFSQLDVEDLPF